MQPDTIIPSFTNPQSLNRYSYTYNNPILYNDPTGHCTGIILDGQCIDTNNPRPPRPTPPPPPQDPPTPGPAPDPPDSAEEDVTIIFCGSGEGGVNAENPNCPGDIAPWVDEGSIVIPWPGSSQGNEDAKYQQLLLAYALTANLNPNAELTIIGYSGGADTAMMFSEGLKNIQSLVLLGPTFSGGMNADGSKSLSSEWVTIFDGLLSEGTNIMVLNDRGWGSGQANNYSKPNGATGTFMPWSDPTFEHFGYSKTDDIHWEATNNSTWLRGRVDQWLVDPNTSMYP